MKTMIFYTLTFLLMLTSGCSEDQLIVNQDDSCIELTISDSLYNYLATVDSLPLGAYFEIRSNQNGLRMEMVDECLVVEIIGGGPNRDGIVYQLVWNGQFNNDTADVYFHIYNPDYIWGMEIIAIGWNEKKAFSVKDIFESKPNSTAFIKTHLNDSVNGSKYVTVIEL